uniref:Amino acid transporter transmembrane domain-containing protein n=1 Tax=Chaetoceros debilis TaxID=122233 RepID=A0A7S3QJ71_9STRA|mmetsp:Transcript_20342/g.29999  ORF Transcript_20342/g.29999 Transcript_20342/m.29999 type:complete len:517 (-) Transcript_20342:34-1584(-)
MTKLYPMLFILAFSIVNAFSSTLTPIPTPTSIAPLSQTQTQTHHNYERIRNHHSPSALAASILVSDGDNFEEFDDSYSKDEMPVGDSGDNPKLSLASAIFNLVKAQVGSGVFALPAGVAAFGDVPAALVPATFLLCLLGLLSAYAFNMIPRLTRLNGVDNKTKIKSMSAAWEDEVGKSSSWIISMCCFLTPLGTTLTFSIILKDILGALAKSAGVTGVFSSKHTLLLGVTAAVLYPLCNLKSLASLAPVSMIGVLGTIATCVIMIARALPNSPYFQAGSAFLNSIPVASRPSFGVIGNNAFSPQILVLVAMVATSLLAHFSSHEFCNDLENNSPKRFAKLTAYSFSTTILINILVMSAGFLTFGGAAQSMVLNNYSPFDVGATFSRLVVAVSLVGSFPILFGAMKSAFFELTRKGKVVSDRFNKLTTQGFVGLLTLGGLLLEDAGLVVSLNGAVMGSFIIYAFPSIIFLKMTSRLVAEGKLESSKRLLLERLFNKSLVGIGGLIAVFGAAVILGLI